MRAENTSSVGGHVALRCDVLLKKDNKDSPVVEYKIVFSTDGNAKSSDRLYSGGISQFESPGRGSSSQDTEPHITVRNSSQDKGLQYITHQLTLALQLSIDIEQKETYQLCMKRFT